MFYLLETGVGAGSRTFTQAPTGSGSATLLPPPPNDNSETARLALQPACFYNISFFNFVFSVSSNTMLP